MLGLPQIHLVSPHTSTDLMRFALLHLCSPHLTRFPSFRLVTLAVQNAALSIVMHIRVSRYPLHKRTLPPQLSAEGDSEGTHIVHCCRHPSFQLEGVPLPRISIPVTPARLSRDLLCRLMETLNPGRPLRHPEFPPICCHQQYPHRYLPSR